MLTRRFLLIFLLLSICIFDACSKSPTQVTVEVEVTRLVEREEIVVVEKDVTRQVPIMVAPEPTQTPVFGQSFPSVVRRDYDNIDCNNPLTMLDINSCAYLRAYSSARELDMFVLELSQQYPNGEWQSSVMLGAAFLAQDDWESHKESYCELEVQGSYGGSIHPLMFFGCIEEQNLSRLGTLKNLACKNLDNIDLVCDD